MNAAKAYFLHNGTLKKGSKLELDKENRSFKYGDGLFETMAFFQSEIPLLKYHFKRFSLGLEMLQINNPFTLPSLKNYIALICKENDIQDHAVLRLNIYRSGGGKYLPLTDKANWVLEISSQDSPFQHNEKGLHIGLYTENLKAIQKLNCIKSNNSLLFIMASLYAKKQSLDDVILLNHKQNIVEATSSNICLIKEGQIISPPESDGPLPGVMRQFLKDHAQELGYEWKEDTLNFPNLLEAEEIFLCNAVSGIKSVKQFMHQQFPNTQAKTIHQNMLNIIADLKS